MIAVFFDNDAKIHK